MTDSPRKSAHILSTFTDSGTVQRFEQGSTHLIDAGSHANYLAAGLIGDPPTTKAAASKPAKRSSPRKSRAKAPAAKPSAPASPPAPPASGESAPGS